MTTPPDPDREQRMFATLQRLYAERNGGGIAQVLLGGGILLVLGVLLTTLVWFVLYFEFGSSYIGWLGWFIVYVIAIAAIVYREEKQSQRPFAQSPHDSTRMLTRIADKLLWTPRELQRGIATLRGRQPVRFTGLLERAARIATRLSLEKEPLLVVKLVEFGESPAQFYEVIDWLDANDHVGLSSDKQRVWISTKLRERLAADRV